MTFSEKIGYKVGSAIVRFKRWKASIFMKITSIAIILILLFSLFFEYRNEGMNQGIYLSKLGTYSILCAIFLIIFKFRHQLPTIIAEYFESPEAYHLRKLREEVRNLKDELKETKNKDKIVKDICTGVYDKHKY